MKSIHFTKTEWAILLVIAIVLIFALSGCESRGANHPKADDGSLSGIPALIQRISLVFAGVATVALFLCGIAAWFMPNKLIAAKYSAIAFTILLAAGLLHWLADHWAWAIGLSGAALIAGIIGYAYLHKKDIQKRVCRALNIPEKKLG